MGYDSHGFEIGNSGAALGYPKPRAKRQGPSPAPAQDFSTDGGQPFTRVWSWHARQAGTNARSIFASPAMTGPAIVKSMTMSLQSHEVAAGIDAAALGWSVDRPVTQRKGPNTTVPPGQVIIENNVIDDNVGDNPQPPFGSPYWGLISQAPGFLELDYIILAPTFYLWAIWETTSVNAFVATGTVTVLNQVSMAALARYTG